MNTIGDIVLNGSQTVRHVQREVQFEALFFAMDQRALVERFESAARLHSRLERFSQPAKDRWYAPYRLTNFCKEDQIIGQSVRKIESG